jgi:hypothetical protein
MSGTWSLSTRAPVVSSTGRGRRDGDCSMHRAADFIFSLPDVRGQQSLSSRILPFPQVLRGSRSTTVTFTSCDLIPMQIRSALSLSL